jgi:hypothetical protein
MVVAAAAVFFSRFNEDTKMDAGNYYVMLNRSQTLCLAAAGSPGKCRLSKFPFSNGLPPVWTLSKVGWAPPGAFWMLYTPMSLYARFGDSSAIIVAPIDLVGYEFLIYFDDVGDGLVAINNHGHDSVMDANGNNPGVGARVTPYSWNGGDNQKWRFVRA